MYNYFETKGILPMPCSLFVILISEKKQFIFKCKQLVSICYILSYCNSKGNNKFYINFTEQNIHTQKCAEFESKLNKNKQIINDQQKVSLVLFFSLPFALNSILIPFPIYKVSICFSSFKSFNNFSI